MNSQTLFSNKKFYVQQYLHSPQFEIIYGHVHIVHVIYKQISMFIVQVQRGLYENSRLIWIVIILV